MIVLDEKHFEEVGFIRLSRLNILLIVGILTVLLIALTYVTIIGTGIANTNDVFYFSPPNLR